MLLYYKVSSKAASANLKEATSVQYSVVGINEGPLAKRRSLEFLSRMHDKRVAQRSLDDAQSDWTIFTHGQQRSEPKSDMQNRNKAIVTRFPAIISLSI